MPAHLASPASRAAAVTCWPPPPAASAARDTRPGPTRGWIRADGQIAGHHARIFTAITEDSTMTTVTVTDRSALAAALRDLKLSGMLDTLDARLAQAHAGELGHLDFLQVLCQDEISRRETTSLARRIRRARFEEQATLEGFDFGASPKLPAAQIRDLAALRWLQCRRVGHPLRPVGVGKSHIAQALAHLAIRSGADARFLKTSRALAHLAGGHADRTWDKRLRELTRPAVLVLDDFAMRELTAAQADDLYELITERAGPLTDPDHQPGARRLVPAVPQPRRRRIPPGPAHQHQPPGLHERAQLPPEQTPRARRPHRDHEQQLE